MRLNKKYIETIKRLTKNYFGPDSKIYLFGSRADDNKKGGDIDLYIETNHDGDVFDTKIKLLVELKKIIGEQKIDIVVNNQRDDKIIYKVAQQEGVIL